MAEGEGQRLVRRGDGDGGGQAAGDIGGEARAGKDGGDRVRRDLGDDFGEALAGAVLQPLGADHQRRAGGKVGRDGGERGADRLRRHCEQDDVGGDCGRDIAGRGDGRVESMPGRRATFSRWSLMAATVAASRA